MFGNILSFELHHRFRKVSTYIYFLIFLLLGFLAIYRASVGGGFLKRLTNAGVGHINANAPFALYYLITFLSHYGILITAAFFGNAAHRDFKEQTYGIYFSYPVKKIHYLAGRFSGAVISILFVFSGVGMGAFLASVSPILTNSEKIGSIQLFSYVQPYLIGVLPNILFAGVLFFCLVLMTRKFVPVYMGIIILLIGYMVGMSLRQSPESQFIATLMDPFGHIAVRNVFDYWTVVQKNMYLVPFSGNLLFNRLVWISLSVVVFMIMYKNFHFSHIIESKKQKSDFSKEAGKKKRELLKREMFKIATNPIFTCRNQIRQVVHTAWYEFKGLTNNIYLMIIVALGAGFIFFLGFRKVGLVNGMSTYPVTSQILEMTKTTFYLFNVVIILFCSGELVWRERNKRMQELIDALPVPEWILFMGKLGALICIQVMMMLIMLFSGIIIQALNGYTHFEMGLYLTELFGIRFIYYSLISVFAMFVQVILNQKFLGYVITLLFIDDFMVSIGLEHHLWTFASTPTYIYSDMNGYGPFLKSIFAYNSFWCSLAVLLIVFSIIFLVRGNESRLKERIKTIKTRLTKAKLRLSGVGLLCCIVAGGHVVYNTTILNWFGSTKVIEKLRVSYEKTYESYEKIPQPRIVDITMTVDIYPDERRVYSSGRMVLKNKTGTDIFEVFIQAPDPDEAKVNKLTFDAESSLKDSSKDFGVYIYRLCEPMRSGEEICLHYDIELLEKGFKDKGINTRLVKNGSFLIWRHVIPEIGYDPAYELEDNDKRKKFGLEPRERIASINDENAKRNHYINRDADWIDFEAKVSTSLDQTALTSGELINEWVEGDRHYFQYKSNGKILKFFPFVSARYSVKKDRWQDVGIEVYYHRDHKYNIDSMIKAVKRSFDYYTTNFVPYQFKMIRIVEFPRYQTFAQSFPTVIPFSEGAGFIAKTDKNKLDLFFKIAAHEVAHQWWAHQVIGANVQGLTLMSEVLSQYSALMVIKNEYDREKINKYVKYELERYLRGRARETQKEVLLFLVEDQGYIHYGKGLVVMNALQDYIGEVNLNAAIREYLQKVAFQEPPYTTSLEFIRYLKEATPDSLRYIITDMFETMTLYDNKAVKASYDELENGQYLVKLNFEASKIKADEIGNEKAIKISDYITFGVFGVEGEELYLKKHFVNDEKNELEFVVDKVPEKAGIDPYYFLIDKNTDNNIIDIEKG